MKEWASLTSKKDVVFKLIKVNNVDLSEWINASPYSSRSGYSSAVANRWLKKWSIDLHLREDKDLRNVMSYRPHFEHSQVNIEQTISRLTDIWNLLEPSAANRFPVLDKYLLRFSLEELYQRATSKNPSGAQFASFITSIFSNLGQDINQVLFNFLLRITEPNDHFIFQEATRDSNNTDINQIDPFPMICRAILLLRLSTGAANVLVAGSSLDVDAIRFWWENISLQNGNVSIVPTGIDAIDLFSDIRDSIDEISSLPTGSLTCIKDAFSQISGPLFYLKQFQRTAIWGMGL